MTEEQNKQFEEMKANRDKIRSWCDNVGMCSKCTLSGKNCGFILPAIAHDELLKALITGTLTE